MTLKIGPNDFTQPDFTVTYTADDGRRLSVGRIFSSITHPADTPWFWSVEFHQRARRAEPHQGYTATKEEAEAAWKRCWESAEVPIRWPPPLQR